MISLSRLILQTVCYYDVFEMPLTSFEIWKHLITPDGNGTSERKQYALSDVDAALREEVHEKRLGERNGFYFLPGRIRLVAERIREDKISTARLKRVRRLVILLRFVPFVRMIGVTGSLSIKQIGKESDWDLFLVLKSGFIFTGRTVITGFLHLLGKRRHGRYTRNRACLNYFVTEDGLEIGTKDLFSAHEYRFLIPFFGFDAFRRFERRNIWIANFKPNLLPTEIAPLWEVRDNAFTKRWREFWESALSSPKLESRLASWQRKKIARNPKSFIPGGLIEASDTALVFLPKPRGPRVFEAWKKRLSEYAIF